MKEAMLKSNKNNKFKFDFSAPESMSVSIPSLKRFLEKDKEAVLIFYGGEPLLEKKKIMEIMDKIDIPYRMQTNGKLLDKLPTDYLNRIEKILISIDGDKERTDFNKGEGTYELVLENIKKARKNGYKGEIIARMTISPEAGASDIYEQVVFLFGLGIFDAVHWQIDAGFYSSDFNYPEFKKFVYKYNKSVNKLIDYWINKMKSGVVLRIYPFIAIIDSLIKKEKIKLRCGAGHSGYAINTDGKITACPIMNCIVDFEAGNIFNTQPNKLKKFGIKECANCSYLDLCGGRCLYWRKAKLWPKKGDDLICKTIKSYIETLKEKLPEIKELIRRGIIKKRDFNYEKYFGPEIIP